jgi:hypothetical protein
LDIFFDEEQLFNTQSLLDPLDSGFVTYKIVCQFVAFKKWHPGTDSASSSEAGLGQHDEDGKTALRASDVHAFLAKEKQGLRSLFRYMTKSPDEPVAQSQPQALTLTHLRLIKKVVNQKARPLVLSRSMLQLDGDPDQGEGAPGEDLDADLKAIILDANLSQDETNGWRAGVTFEEFESAMRRLSMFTPAMDH